MKLNFADPPGGFSIPVGSGSVSLGRVGTGRGLIYNQPLGVPSGAVKAPAREIARQMQGVPEEKPTTQSTPDTYPENDIQGFKKGGKVKISQQRGDGIAQRGKTKGRFV